MTGNSVATTFRGWLNSALRLLVVVGVLAASLLGGAQSGGAPQGSTLRFPSHSGPPSAPLAQRMDMEVTPLLPLKTARADSSNSITFAAGILYTCAIKGGALYCWGYNGFGQLGGGGIITPVTNMNSGVTAVAAGWYHTCAVKSGALHCWGYNSNGSSVEAAPVRL